MCLNLHDKVALLTGAARGQGEAEARLFAERGCKVVITDVLDDDGQRVADDIGDAAVYVHLDVRDPDDWKRAVTETVDRFGELNVLINNAAVLRQVPLESMALEDYRELCEINEIGCFLGIQSVTPALRAAGGGSIVNISSIMGLAGLRRLGAYSASKFAVRGLTRVAAMELGPAGIRVNAIHPGFVESPMNESDHPDGRPGKDRRPMIYSKLIPLRRAAAPREIAELAAFLASDASSYCTGGEFLIDGGLLAGVEFGGDR